MNLGPPSQGSSILPRITTHFPGHSRRAGGGALLLLAAMTLAADLAYRHRPLLLGGDVEVYAEMRRR